jgi:alpha-L-fucosidase
MFLSEKLMKPKYLLIVFLFPILCSGQTVKSYKKFADSSNIFLSDSSLKISNLINGSFRGDYCIGLTKPGQWIKLTELPAASKLAIRYASLNVGTISIAVNNQEVRKVNVHSSGNITNSFLQAKVDITIPPKAVLTISLSDNDVPVNIDEIIIGNGNVRELKPDIWNLPQLPIASGPYLSDWKEIARQYTVPEWWRDAKFGAWAHWDPQSMPEQGEWYARGMYIQGSKQYEYNVKNFGHPSEYGYKDICHNWKVDRWNPEELMDLYIEMGARYFVAMGVHHDNFDCWNSVFQPWNSVNVGPKIDIVGVWEKIARQHNMHFGISFHNTPARTWGQFMPVRYACDKSGQMQGVPYDVFQTIFDGKGKWWEGLDPVDLYGPVHDENNPLKSPFTNQFMWRVDDAISKYHPDIICFDEHAGDSQVDLGVHMGLGYLAPQLIANFYNKSFQWNNCKTDVVVNLKGVGGHYNSFQNNPELIPFVERSLVKSTEAIIEPEIMAYPFQTETSLAEWHYQVGQKYMDAATVIQLLIQNVSRNGSMLLNCTQHGRGDLDVDVIQICKDIGAWMKINGEAVYGSRPFEIYGEDGIFYMRNNGNVYATINNWSDSSLTLKALHTGGATIGKVSKVEMLGSNVELTFIQSDKGLTISPKKNIQPFNNITDQRLASKYRVLRITHDKVWINDDDKGVVAVGWNRYCNLGTGDYNNDLSTSENVGDVWSCSFFGNSVAVIAPKENGAGKVEIRIDDGNSMVVDLSTAGLRQVQQVIYEAFNLNPAKHIIRIVNQGFGRVAIDAIAIGH